MVGMRGWNMLAWTLLVAGAVGCVQKVESPAAGSASKSTGSETATGESPAMGDAPAMKLTGSINVDGSSTVYPITQGVAEKFNDQAEDVEISVGLSGTGGGMKKFVVNEIDICDASRPIKDSEKEECSKKGIEYLELQVAIDGLSVVVHPANDWVDCMTVAELKKIWEPNSKVVNWSDVNPQWPAEPIKLFGADTDSGTFEYFTEVVNGKAKESRTDYTSSSNDTVLVTGVTDSKYALGYFGYGYYELNKDRLKVLSIKKDDNSECIAPTPATIENGTYSPMARPLFIYVNKKALARPEVAAFVKYYLSEEGQVLVSERKFIRMPPDKLKEMQDRLAEALK